MAVVAQQAFAVVVDLVKTWLVHLLKVLPYIKQQLGQISIFCIAEVSATTKCPKLLASFIPGSWSSVVTQPVFVVAVALLVESIELTTLKT
ncbi:hypothetical protein [Microcoleus sp. B13-B4]|uniref:hypothetical protein n=1 Tax=unclassified Microcoleus TaxID=2642155 RepID=UPI002FD57B10